MDQAAKLRELVERKNNSIENSLNMISVVSGKGGVGKTTLVTRLYSECENSYIVDSDINAPYFWLYKKQYKYSAGFESFNGRTIVRNVDKQNNLGKYENVFVDAGTGINDVNQYYLSKSRLVVFVSNLEDISIVNTMNLMKRVECTKVMFLQNADSEQMSDMQSRVDRYAKAYLNDDVVRVYNVEEDLAKFINSKRY